MKNLFKTGRGVVMTYFLAAITVMAFSMPQGVMAKKKIGFQLYTVMGAMLHRLRCGPKSKSM